MARWRGAGASVGVVWGRWAVLHSALSWAVAQRYLRRDPLEGMRAPVRPVARKHLLGGGVPFVGRGRRPGRQGH
jgi:hypothetical protein